MNKQNNIKQKQNHHFLWCMFLCLSLTNFHRKKRPPNKQQQNIIQILIRH